MTEILFEKDKETNTFKYNNFRVDEVHDRSCPTLLHLAAEKNFVGVAKIVLRHSPKLLYRKTEKYDDEIPYFAVETAILNYQDEVAAYLINQMKHDWWVMLLHHITLNEK